MARTRLTIIITTILAVYSDPVWTTNVTDSTITANETDSTITKAVEEYKSLCPYNYLCNSVPSESVPYPVDGIRSPGSCCTRCTCWGDCGTECCPDKPSNYLSDQEIDYINSGATQCLRTQFKTVDSDDPLRNGAFTTVVACPEDYSDNVISARCSRSYQDFDLSEDMSFFGTVSNGSSVFKNKYCALCNGVNESAIVVWQVSIRCIQPAMYPNVRTMREIIDAVNNEERCDLLFGIEDWSPYRDLMCRPLIDRCNITGLWEEFDPDIERACVSYKSLYKDEYKNVHCFLCNSRSAVEVQAVCDTMPGGFIPSSFIALIDFNGLGETSEEETTTLERCPIGSEYDPSRRECRPLICPEFMAIRDEECISIFQNLQGFNDATHYVTISLEPRSSISSLHLPPGVLNMVYDVLKAHVGNVFQSLDHDFYLCNIYGFIVLRENVSVVLESFLANEERQYAFSDLAYFAVKMEIGYYGTDSLGHELPIIENMFENYTQNPFLSQYIIRFRNVPLSLFERALDSRVSYETDGNPDIDALLNSTVPDSVLRESLGSSFYDEATGFVIAPMHTPRRFQYCGAVTRFQVQSLCPKVELFPDEINVTDQGIEINLITNSSLELNEVIFTTENSVLVCYSYYFDALNFTEIIEYESNALSDSYSPITIVTIVVLALSIVSLMITLIVYFLFKQLRSLPGLNIIALVISLLASHLLTMLNGIIKIGIGYVCIGYGVVLHFALLLSIFWMFVCTYHMAKVFINLKTMQPVATNKYRVFIRYICFTVIVSVLFVGTNIVVSSTKSYGNSLGYDDVRCYIETTDMVLFTVAVPVGLVVLSNIVMFMCVMIKLSRAPSLKDAKNQERNNLKIFAKLSTITGITYCFGFLYQFTAIEALSYVFVILNASQGVFIMAAFVLNRRVANMIKAFYTERRNSSIKKTYLQQSSSSTGQNTKKKTGQSKVERYT